MDVLAQLNPPPSGFGNCRRCPYRDTKSVPICYACARKGMTALAATRCPVCDLTLKSEGAQCGNPVCGWDNRQFEWSHAVALRAGSLKKLITRYKYQEEKAWKLIFGRVLAGYFDQHVDAFTPFDLIIASPTYVGEGGRAFDHTAEVLAEAARLSEHDLPFVTDEPIIAKTAATKRLVECESWSERYEVCERQVRPALRVARSQRLAGKSVLVYDDVFTDGLNLNVVAGVLRKNGAIRVCGVTLARQPWGND